MKSFFKNLYKHPKPTSIQSVRLEGIYRLCLFIFREHAFSTHLSLFWLRRYMWLELLPFSPLRNHSRYQERLRERPPLSRGHGEGTSPQMPFRASGSSEDPSRPVPAEATFSAPLLPAGSPGPLLRKPSELLSWVSSPGSAAHGTNYPRDCPFP